jgi:hypothetical protein
MSCDSEDSYHGGSFLKWVILLLLGAFLLANSKEIARYIKISSM